MSKDLWLEFLDPELHVCGLCGNHGRVDITVKTPAGVVCRTQKPCICPNGRSIKAQLEGATPRRAAPKHPRCCYVWRAGVLRSPDGPAQPPDGARCVLEPHSEDIPCDFGKPEER